MLYTISKILTDDLLQHCIDLINLQQDASLLLYQDGVYLAIANSTSGKKLAHLYHNKSIYVLTDDLIARGIKDKLLKNVTGINYMDFVNLTIQHNKMVSW
jgi:tRNA 2-thiouridine synthesizing protein B